MAVDKDAVLAALREVVDPAQGRDIVSAGMVQGLAVTGSAVGFAIEVDPRRGPQLEPLRKAAEQAARGVPGVESATVVLTAHSETPGAAPKPAAASRRRSGAAGTSTRHTAQRATFSQTNGMAR